MPRRGLEIGGGEFPLKDTGDIIWKQINRGWGVHKLQEAGAVYDEVFASQVIEHCEWFRVDAALKEAYRLLKHGGLIEIWTMDFDKIVRAYLEGKMGCPWNRYNPENDPMLWVNGRIFAYGDSPSDPNWHRSCHTPTFMKQLLEKAKFTDIQLLTAEERRRGTGHGPCEFGVRARKP